MSKTMGMLFAEIRADKSITLKASAIKAGVSEALVWKMENDRPTYWESVHAVLTKSFHCLPGSRDYEAMHLLWLNGRAERSESPSTEQKNYITGPLLAIHRQFKNLIRDHSIEDAKKILTAAAKAAAKMQK